MKKSNQSPPLLRSPKADFVECNSSLTEYFAVVKLGAPVIFFLALTNYEVIDMAIGHRWRPPIGPLTPSLNWNCGLSTTPTWHARGVYNLTMKVRNN